MIIFVKDEDDVLVIPVGLGPNVGEQECPEPVMEDITLDSSTVEQTVTPGEGVDGFSGVTVNPYILDTKTVDSSTVSQTITSDEDGLSSVTVNPYTTETRTAEITTNGTFVYTPATADALSQVTVDVSINTVDNQSKTVDSSTVSQNVTPDTGYTGLGNVTVNPYVLDTKTVDPSTSQITVNSSADGLSGVTVTAVTSGIDNNITSGNIKSGVSILGVTGSYSGEPANLQDVSLSYTQNGSYTVSASSGYDGLGTVDIDVSVSGGGGGGDWVIAARKGDITDIRGYSYDGLLDTSYGGYYMFYGNNTVTAMSTDTSTIGYYGMQQMFANSTALTTVDLSSVRTVNEYGMGNVCANCSSLTGTLDLRDLQSVGISGFYRAFYNTRLTTVYMPKMKDIPNNAFRDMFYNDSSLEHIYMDFSELETIGDYGTYGMTEKAGVNLGNDNAPDFPQLKTIGTFGGTSGGVALDFSNSPNVTYISFPKLETVNGEIRFQNCTNLTGDVSFPELTSCGNIRYNFRYAFTNTGITSLTFNKLTGLGGSYFGYYMCQGCPNLTTVSFPELTSISGSNFSYAFADCSSLTTVSFPKVSYMMSNSIGQYMFQNCPNLVNFEAHPTFFQYANSYGNQFFSTIRNLTLTANIVKDLRLDYMQNLTADSVLNVLQHCDDTPGIIGTRNIYFYTGGLTVTDYPDGRIQAAYDAAVGPHSNVTFVINRLTILPYS